jgi:hypothetical protein
VIAPIQAKSPVKKLTPLSMPTYEMNEIIRIEPCNVEDEKLDLLGKCSHEQEASLGVHQRFGLASRAALVF